jgi:hypothetical protein
MKPTIDIALTRAPMDSMGWWSSQQGTHVYRRKLTSMIVLPDTSANRTYAFKYTDGFVFGLTLEFTPQPSISHIELNIVITDQVWNDIT